MSEQARRSASWLWVAVGIAFAVGALDAVAGQIYTYRDGQGNFVATDSLANVPKQYRARVTVKEVRDSDPVVSGPPSARAGEPTTPFSVQSLVFKLAEYYPKALVVPGTNAFQSLVLAAGALAAVLMLAGMNLSGNPAVRLLMKFMLGFLVVTAAYAMYFSTLSEQAAKMSGGPGSTGNFIEKARESARMQEAIHRQRAREIDSLEQPASAPK